MANSKDVVRLAVDAHKGSVEKYSVRQSQDVLREALVEANNGKTSLDYRDIRDGKCGALFNLIEEVLNSTVYEGLTEDMYFNTLVDYRNVALGDSPVFVVEDQDLFVVSDASEGNLGIRRQRLTGTSEAVIPTSLKLIRFYDELNRVLAGRVDMNHFIDVASESMKQKILNDIYSLWVNATADQLGGITYFPAAGSYDEDTLLDLVAHVEAAAGGKTATIIGTKKAVRHLVPVVTDIAPEIAKESLYNEGYVGKFYGSNVVAVPQRHKVGTSEFILDDNSLTIIAGDDKPIKLVTEGDSILLVGDPVQNADLTQEYYYGERYGLGIVLAGNNAGIGRYEMV